MTLPAITRPASAQVFFTITGDDDSGIVTVSATGSFTATTTLNISNSSQFWNGYGDFVTSTRPSTDFALSSGITLANTTINQSSPLTNLSFNNSAESSDGDIFSLTINPGLMASAGDSFTISGTATFTLPVAFSFSDYFNGPGTFATAETRNPFGVGPSVTIASTAVPEPVETAVVLGAAVALFAALRRR